MFLRAAGPDRTTREPHAEATIPEPLSIGQQRFLQIAATLPDLVCPMIAKTDLKRLCIEMHVQDAKILMM
jgi:hypothetical protein